ncbi:MAG: carboxypeptidase regulatory-like domain-containing protein [Gemmatimonadaceae bacterium]
MLIFPIALDAQSQATTGIIRGTTVDSSGRVLPAIVMLRNVETNFRRTVQASDRGVFVATLLPLGTYELTARSVGYAPVGRPNLIVNVGQTLDIPLVFAPSVMQMGAITITGMRPTVDTRRPEAATALDALAVGGLPNNGRNFLNLTTLTPNVAVTQGPDGDVLSVGGQRGIHNNVSVDGADFNNPFFGEQRGGQRPAFTFNLDAVREMVVVSQGANAEFGRSGGGFVNVITKSGTNTVHGTLHYYGKDGGLSSPAVHGPRRLDPDFRQHQFGFTLGGPIRRDKLFYFVAYDQQAYTETKQTTRPSSAALTQLTTFLNSAYGGALAGDFGAIERSNDAQVAMVKLDWRINDRHLSSLKYNYTNSRQERGTFDVDTWGRSANGIEKDFSNAINGSLASHFGNFDNEFRFQLAREDRPRDYEGPAFPSGRKFPDTAMDFANGFRFGQPFFLPVESYDTRIQVLDNVSMIRGNHLVKIGFEWNRTEEKQTFIGFANGRFIFNSVAGFQGYVQNGPNYVECSDATGAVVTTNNAATCPAGTSISGPVLLYLQQAGVGGRSVEEAGTQAIPQHDLALYIQDTWKASANLTVNYGLRWEGQKQPDPITPPSQVFFAPLIGTTRTNATGTYAFPSDGTIPSDMMMLQPRLGVAWDVDGDGRQVVRGSAGLYYARIPGLNLASARSTNGSIGQTMFRNSALIGILGAPPAYDQLLPAPAGAPFNPDVFVFDKDFRNPRTLSASAGYEREIGGATAASVSYTYAKTDFLTRFVNRNDAVFGSPWANSLPGGNGIGQLTTVESSAKSQYHGITLGLARMASPDFQYQVNYTLSQDRSDDDNERDPFKFFYARADRLDREYGYSERDQRHRVNAWALRRLVWQIYANNRFTYTSAQPRSAICAANPIGAPSDRICPDGSILQRNTIRRDNSFASWDLRLSRKFASVQSGQVEAIVEIFNVLNRDNFRDPSASSLLFNFDGTIRNGLGDPRQIQIGARYGF